MRKTWIILRFVGFFVCLFIFIWNARGLREKGPEVNKAVAQVSQAWNKLEQAAPILTREYNSAIKKEREVVAAYSSLHTVAFISIYPMAFLFISLVWQFAVEPIRTWQNMNRPQRNRAT